MPSFIGLLLQGVQVAGLLCSFPPASTAASYGRDPAVPHPGKWHLCLLLAHSFPLTLHCTQPKVVGITSSSWGPHWALMLSKRLFKILYHHLKLCWFFFGYISWHPWCQRKTYLFSYITNKAHTWSCFLLTHCWLEAPNSLVDCILTSPNSTFASGSGEAAI